MWVTNDRLRNLQFPVNLLLFALGFAATKIHPALGWVVLGLTLAHVWGLAFRLNAGKPFWELAMCANCEKLQWRWDVRPIWRVEVGRYGGTCTPAWGCEDCALAIEFREAVARVEQT